MNTLLDKLIPILEALGEFLAKALLTFLAFRNGANSVTIDTQEKDLKDAEDAQEIRDAVHSLSDADLDYGLLADDKESKKL